MKPAPTKATEEIDDDVDLETGMTFKSSEDIDLDVVKRQVEVEHMDVGVELDVAGVPLPELDPAPWRNRSRSDAPSYHTEDLSSAYDVKTREGSVATVRS